MSNGIERLYIIGRNEERDFVAKVITAILAIRELKGLELFTLYRDYRGQPEGVGALIGVDGFISKLGLSPRFVPGIVADSVASQMSDELPSQGEVQEQEASVQSDLCKITEDIVVQLSDFDREWISLADFGSRIRLQIPGFTPERYGGRNLISVLRKLSILEFDERGTGPAKAVYIRLVEPSDQKNDSTDISDLYETVADIVDRYANEDGWIFLGTLGHNLKLNIDAFTPRLIPGASTLHDFITSIPTIEVEERGENHSKTYVRAKRSR